MGDTDDGAPLTGDGPLRSIRVTASHAGMSVLGDDSDGPRPADRTAATLFLDPLEPMSLLAPGEPAGILQRHTRFLGSLRTSASLRRPVPELVFRPPGGPAARPDDARSDADGSPNVPDAGQPATAANRPAPPGLQVPAPRSSRTSSGTDDPDDLGRTGVLTGTPAERRTRERPAGSDDGPAAPSRDAPQRRPAVPGPPEFTYVSPPWSGESSAGVEPDPGGSASSGSEAGTDPGGVERERAPDEQFRGSVPDERPGAAGASGMRAGGESVPDDPKFPSSRARRPTESARGSGSFPVSAPPPTEPTPPRGRDGLGPSGSEAPPGRDPTVAARSSAATGSSSIAELGRPPVSRTPLTVVRRLADASSGQAAAAGDEPSRTPGATGVAGGAGEPPDRTTGSPDRTRSAVPKTTSRPGFTVVDRSGAAPPRSGTDGSSQPATASRSSFRDAPSVAGDEAPTGASADAPAGVDDLLSPTPGDPPAATPGGRDAAADRGGRRRRPVDAPGDRERASPTAPGRAVSLVVRRRLWRDRPDDAAEGAATGRTVTTRERARVADPGAATGPGSPAPVPGPSPDAAPDAAAADDVHRLPMSVAADAAPGGESLIETEPSGVEEMPSMTLRDAGGGGRRSVGEDAGESRRSSVGAGGATERGSAGAPDRGSVSPSPGGDRRGGVDRRSESGSAPTRDATRGPEASPPSGRDASTVYPEFTFRTLAPRIDATRVETSERRDVTYRDDGRRSEPAADRADIADLPSAGELERSTYPVDVDRLVEKLQRDIERKRRIDRERRGL